MTAIIQTMLLLLAVPVAVALIAQRLKMAPSILLVLAGIALIVVPGCRGWSWRRSWCCWCCCRRDPLLRLPPPPTAEKPRQQRQKNSADQDRDPENDEPGNDEKRNAGDQAEQQETEDDRGQARPRQVDAMHAVALLEAHEDAGLPGALVAIRRDDLGLVARALRTAVGISVVGHDLDVGWQNADGNERLGTGN
jgi:hypothetical protein